jgi:hypothetical protein
MRLRRLYGLLFLIILSALTVKARETAPQFAARTLGGETFTNGSLRGQVVLVQFWTTW